MSLFHLFVSFYISTTWWVSLLVDQWVPRGTCSQVLRSTSVDSYCLRASKFSVIKLFEIVILWVYYTIPFGFSLFWHVWDISFQLLKLLRTTDEGSVPEMRIWSILLIKSDLKWCIHLSRSLFLYYKVGTGSLHQKWLYQWKEQDKSWKSPTKVPDKTLCKYAHYEIYTWTFCHSYLHEKQTSRIQSLSIAAHSQPLLQNHLMGFDETW